MVKPNETSRCIECGEPIADKPYEWTKRRGQPPVFIHRSCYEKLLPHKKEDKPHDTKSVL